MKTPGWSSSDRRQPGDYPRQVTEPPTTLPVGPDGTPAGDRPATSGAVWRVIRSPALGSFAARAAGMGGAFAMSVAILRALSAPDAGLVLLAYTLLTIAAAIARFGADNLALREVSRAPGESSALVRHSFTLCLVLAPLASVLLFGALLLQGGRADVVQVALAAALGVLPAALSIVGGAVLRGCGRVAAGTFAELGSPRGRQGSPRERVVLPEGWLDDADGSGCHLQEDANETTGG